MCEEKDSYGEYWQNVRGIVDDALAENEIKTREQYESRQDEINDRVWESVDGSYWVIYYHAAHKTMQHTENEDALIEALGEIGKCDSFGAIVTQFAFYAMYQDVMDCLARVVDELPDADESEGSDQPAK